jgi:hypothetical protein
MKEAFKSLSDQDLLTLTAKAANTEKAATLALLEHLAEVDERRAYAILSFSSLFDYVTRGLGYSESQASERVNAVRLLRQNARVREHLESGALTLTVAAQIQRYVVAEKKQGEALQASERARLIETCLNQSKREVERTLLARASEPVKIAQLERVRTVSLDLSEIKFLANEEQMQTLNRARELFPDDALAGLMERALKLLISEKEKQLGKECATVERPVTPPAVQPNESGIAGSREAHRSPKQLESRYIPREFRRILYSRSGGQCEFVSEISGERCRSRSRLQIDHIRPMAFDGGTDIENLRHLCASHNLKSLEHWAREAGMRDKLTQSAGTSDAGNHFQKWSDPLSENLAGRLKSSK